VRKDTVAELGLVFEAAAGQGFLNQAVVKLLFGIGAGPTDEFWWNVVRRASPKYWILKPSLLDTLGLAR
jgi:hypothetical protein